ncbi:MAG TPA: hypothetical protein VLJ39_14630 [Tepidisphaeraceae bacterium]|nr:hypothetical protein [Tepidisphaeraceae bacterium]
MRKYYMPSPDGNFRSWLRNFVTVLQTLMVALGIPMVDVTKASDAADALDVAMDEHTAAQAVAESKRQAKTEKRDEAEILVRALVKRIQASPACTDEMRHQLQITVPKPDRSKPAVPTARPVIEVEQPGGLKQVIRANDSETGKRGKPAGTVIEVRMMVLSAGAPVPVSAEELPVLTFATSGKIEHAFGGGDVGKTAVWGMRYVNSAGEAGPWGTIATGTIAA